MKVRARILVSGIVQGVFFRSQTRQEARSYNVTGWIGNRSDGKVEAVFEGEEISVRKLVEFCRSGSPGARVDKIEVILDTYTGEFADFRIVW